MVVNIQPHNSKLKNFIRDLEPVVAMQPDALIMSDPGLIMMVRENFPDMPVHLCGTSQCRELGNGEILAKYGFNPCHSFT